MLAEMITVIARLGLILAVAFFYHAWFLATVSTGKSAVHSLQSVSARKLQQT